MTAQEGTWSLGKWKCWHTVGPHIQYSEKKSSRDKRRTVVREELSSCGRDGNEANWRVGPAGRGSMAHRGFSVHCKQERGGVPWAGISFSLPLGKWNTFLRGVLEKRERQRGRETDLR